jgi:hypothetical protein
MPPRAALLAAYCNMECDTAGLAVMLRTFLRFGMAPCMDYEAGQQSQSPGE